jgi:signal peptidase I
METTVKELLEDKSGLLVLCPSRSRASRVTTTKFISDLVLVVNSDQKDEYIKHNPDIRVISPPEDVKGITPTRQWMVDNFPAFFMVDDDVVAVKRNYVEPGEEAEIDDPTLVREIIEHSYYLCKLLGAKMFSYPSTRNPLEYIAHEPFKFTGYFNNSHTGFVEDHGLKYHLGFGEAEDYYISLLNAYKNRYGFFDCRFTFITKDNFVGDGGCCEYRTEKMMLDNTIRLRKMFGDAVVVKRATHVKKNIHQGERSILIPY